MRPSRNLLSAAVLFSPFLLPATSMAAAHSWCVTGDALVTPDATYQDAITDACSKDSAKPTPDHCCATGGRWSLDCVQWAADYAKRKGVGDNNGDHCGRYAWTQGPLTGTQQYFPRDFSLVALAGDIFGPPGISHVENPAAASRNIQAISFALNYGKNKPVAAAAGGDLNFDNGTVYGTVAHAGNLNDTSTVTYIPPSGQVKASTPTPIAPLNFSDVRTTLVSMSSFIGGYTTNASATEAYKVLTFAGTDNEMNVFSVTAADVTGKYAYQFNVPADSAVIINVFKDRRTEPKLANAGFSGNVNPRKLLWNFPESQTVKISSIGFKGSVLAPLADVTLSDGVIDGTVVGKSIYNYHFESHSATYNVPATTLALAKQYIKHVVVIMQENRSFDHYFGTYPNPGGNGMPSLIQGKKYSCDPSACTCCDTSTPNCNSFPATTYSVSSVNPSLAEADLPHGNGNFKQEILGQINDPANPSQYYLSPIGFLQQACSNAKANGKDPAKAMGNTLGHHDGTTDIGNYWAYAQNYLLQDRMFESVPSWSPVEHNYMVSGWNASCTSSGCATNVVDPSSTVPYPWTNITTMLDKPDPANPSGPKVFWKYYNGNCWDYNCNTCSSDPRACIIGSANYKGSKGRCDATNGTQYQVIDYWNQLKFYKGVDTARTNASLMDFYNDVYDSTDPDGSKFPAVSWIVPGKAVSEHAELGVNSDIKWGQAYVTSIINAIMSKQSLWQTTAIFLSWDDWGGFYDHVVAEETPFSSIDPNDTYYGFRVPGLLITPWTTRSSIDHQMLTHDAYLKLIEDLFLGSHTIGGSQGLYPDDRLTHRETSSKLGNLVNEFDFSHGPLPSIGPLTCYVP